VVLGSVPVPGLEGQLMVGTRSSVNAGWNIPLLALTVLGLTWFLFFSQKAWRFFPDSWTAFRLQKDKTFLGTEARAGSLKYVQSSLSITNDRLRDHFLEGSLERSSDSVAGAWGQEAEDGQNGTELLPARSFSPPQGLPKLFLQRKAEERKSKIFDIELNLDERQSFVRRMSIEVSELQDLTSLGAFFSKTFTRLLDGAPAAFFAVDTKDGRVQLLSRFPIDLFSSVVPAAFLPLDSEDLFEKSAANYMRDVSLLSSDLIAAGTEWTIFGLGAGNRKAGFWAFPLKMGQETKFFVRMLCEVFLGHYLFLKSEEIEKRKTFFQGNLLHDRILEETLQNTRLRHSLIFGVKADETL
jgi:hypothetical protein